MSLRSLAQKHLSATSDLGLSHRDTPKECPSGTNNSLAISGGTNETHGTGGTENNIVRAEAYKRNRRAAGAGLTDRWCDCGNLATLAIGRFRASKANQEGVARWVCCTCFGNGELSLEKFCI
jgi:hypothetical protein